MSAALVEVTQAARDAAADLISLAERLAVGGNDAAAVRNGFWDHDTKDVGMIVRAFARAINEAELRGARLMQEAAAEAPQRVRDKYWLAPIPCAYCEAEIRALDPAVIISRATLTETSHDR